jgi:hypothetical protein
MEVRDASSFTSRRSMEMCDRRSHRRNQKHEGAIPNFASQGTAHLYPHRGCSDSQGRVEQSRPHFRGCTPKQKL